MTIAEITISRHPKKPGYFILALCGDCDSPGEGRIELPLSEPALRALRESADRALKNKPALKIEFLTKKEK